MQTLRKEENANDLKESAKSVGEAADYAVNKAKNELNHAANDAGRKVRKFIRSASDDVVHAKDTVKHQIHENPVQSTFIALGLGFVLGALLRR